MFAAYGWEGDIGDDEILARLLVLNLERAQGQGETPQGVAKNDTLEENEEE